MNEILIKTHKESNINILKARDVFFDRARNRYRIYLIVVFIPIIVALLTYVPSLYLNFGFIENKRDYIIGIASIIFLLISKILDNKNKDDLEISNTLREYYDCEVFELERNPYLCDFTLLFDDKGKWKKEIINAWESRADIPSGKYEVWYGEIFCNNRRKNILAFQMDNVMYTYYIYKEYLKRIELYIKLMYAFVSIILLSSIFIWKTIVVFVLMMFSLAGAIQLLLEMKSNTEELIKDNNAIFNYVKNNSNEIKAKLAESDSVIRNIQDAIIKNRKNSLFVPSKVRNVYLKKYKGNPYYIQLNSIFSIYFDGEQLDIPENECDIEVLSKDKETPITTLDKVHERLMTMLLDLDTVLKNNNIHYMLDGGTLIGAVRKDERNTVNLTDGKFIFWDDDIDISIKSSDINRLIKAIEENLLDKYDIQYYDNEEFYSPRLSNIRIREKVDKSILCEKDSELYEKYKYRGLFIDIYAYSPILINKTIDGLWRKVFIYGLYKKIKSIENAWKYGGKDNRVKNELRFIDLKKKYLNRVKWYLTHAKNENYYCYTPNYIENLKKAGPYISKDVLYGKEVIAEFEGHKFNIPSKTDEVLTRFYGKEWFKSPFKSVEALLKEYSKDNWYSEKLMSVTALKHYKYIEKF